MKFTLKLYFSVFSFLVSVAAFYYAQTYFLQSVSAAKPFLNTHTNPNAAGGAIKNPTDSRLALVPVEGEINGDQLVTINGIPWAANGWPFSRVLAVQRDSIDSSIVGRVVLDRHGYDEQPEYGIRAPFAAPKPGRAVLISNWGSNDKGCFVELIIQIAVSDEQKIDPSLIVPTQIETIINGQRVTMKAVDAPGADRYASFPYTYSLSVDKDGKQVSVELPGTWTMSRHLFVLNAAQAGILSSAPVQNIPIRVTLTNRSPITFPVGKGTVERWSSVYGSNASCVPKRVR